MITSLAKSRMKYNKSRTVLTAVAILLATALLTALGTSAIGLLDFNKQQASQNSNIHATFKNITQNQADTLKNHVDIESIKINEIFATVEYGKMNGFLTYSNDVKGHIYQGTGNIIKGRLPENENEICGPKAFFKRMNTECKIGNSLNISFRPGGKGKIQTKKFIISGILSERDISKANISDSRIVYGAVVSEKLTKEFIPEDEHVYNVALRVYGENNLNYDEIVKKINNVASDIDCSKNDVILNKEYLVTMTDPGTDMMKIVGGIGLLITLFSGIAIYSIYYVGVITDVQEIGKLKAIGATNRQIRRLLMREGLFISAISVPAGYVLGYILPFFLLPVILQKATEMTFGTFPVGKIHMFSLPVLIGVILLILATVYISLLKPAKMADKISPSEAIRYQESGKGKKMRKENINVNVFRLSSANLLRNKRRTIITMLTMTLSCVLFMSTAGVLNSMDPTDIANRELDGSDFRISLDYALNDKAYPENNLENLNQRNLFSDKLIKNISNTDGVQKIRKIHEVPVSSDYSSEIFTEGNKITISELTAERAAEYSKDIKRGDIDYDKLSKNNGAVFTSDVFWEEYNMKLGDDIHLTVYDGSRTIPLTIKIMASVDDGHASMFMVPETVYDSLKLENSSTTDLYIDVDDSKYESVKATLKNITDSEKYFELYSKDEEMRIGVMSVSLIKYPMYSILLIIAVIGFMNLINTMITSIITRKRELGMLQAIGLSDKQFTKMLAGEGLVFTAVTFVASLTIGNVLGYLVFLYGKGSGFMSVTSYHYPVAESICLATLLILCQLSITFFIGKRVKKESLIDRIRSGE